MSSELASDVTIHAYRARGGAVVKVTRVERTRRYRVGSARFLRLRDAITATLRTQRWTGYFGSSSYQLSRWPA